LIGSSSECAASSECWIRTNIAAPKIRRPAFRRTRNMVLRAFAEESNSASVPYKGTPVTGPEGIVDSVCFTHRPVTRKTPAGVLLRNHAAVLAASSLATTEASTRVRASSMRPRIPQPAAWNPGNYMRAGGYVRKAGLEPARPSLSTCTSSMRVCLFTTTACGTCCC
jgi:hypothetical protein